MADQVNLTGSLSPAVSMAHLVAKPSTQPPQEKPLAAKPDPAAIPLEAKGVGQAAPTDSVQSAAKVFTDFLQSNRSDLEFQVDKATGEPYFKIVNAKTKEVIRQVPSEEMLAMARKLRELADAKSASGVLVDKED